MAMRGALVSLVIPLLLTCACRDDDHALSNRVALTQTLAGTYYLAEETGGWFDGVYTREDTPHTITFEEGGDYHLRYRADTSESGLLNVDRSETYRFEDISRQGEGFSFRVIFRDEAGAEYPLLESFWELSTGDTLVNFPPANWADIPTVT